MKPDQFKSTSLTHLPLDEMAAILADDIFKSIFLNENDRILIQISQKFVPRDPIDNKPALVQVMAWCRTGIKPLPEAMLTQFTEIIEILMGPVQGYHRGYTPFNAVYFMFPLIVM